MSSKRPLEEEEQHSGSPGKKQNTSHAFTAPLPPSTPPTFTAPLPPTTPQRHTRKPAGLPPPTPKTAVRFGISSDEGTYTLDKIDNFPALVEVVQRMIWMSGGEVAPDAEFGVLLLNAAKEVTVYP